MPVLAATLCLLVQDPVTLTGRLLDARGAPLPGARLELSAAPRDPEIAATWTPVASTADEAGRLRARFTPPGVPVAGRVDLPEGGTLVWTWHELEAGATVALGDVRLPPTAEVAGRIVLPGGDVLTEGWDVTLDVESRLPSGARLRVRRGTQPSAATGEFRFEDVPALPLRIAAEHGFGMRVATTLTDVAAGGEAFVELRHPGLDPRRHLRVHLDHPWSVEHRKGAVVAIDAEGRVVEGRPMVRVLRTIAFHDLAPGAHRLEVRDPAFEPVTVEDVRPGRRIVVPLRGAATVRLRVIEGRDGPPLERYGLRAGRDLDRSAVVLNRDAAPAPRDGEFGGLPATPLVLEVRPPRREPVRIPVEDLEAGEVRPIDVSVPPPER